MIGVLTSETSFARTNISLLLQTCQALEFHVQKS